MAEANRDVELLREVLGELPAVLKNAPVMLALPSLLLAIGAVLDAWVASLHAVMPAVVGIAKGLGWALVYAPADLRYPRMATHPHGARLDHLLPADYRAFVKEVGYPVLGFSYYDRQGTTFLPPVSVTMTRL